MSLACAAGIIFAKELRTEFRARELLTTTVVFVLLVLALFSFTFEPAALGVATVGTVLSAISTHARMRELMLPLLLLPALTPVLIASTEVTAGLLSESPALNWEGVAFLVVFDIVFLTAAWLFGEYLFDE